MSSMSLKKLELIVLSLVVENQTKTMLISASSRQRLVALLPQPFQIPGLVVLALILTPLINQHPVIAAQFLTRGSRGQDVATLQNDLKQASCFPGDVRSTGYYGRITQAAVRKLQQTNGLNVDGMVGEQTHGALSTGKACVPSVNSRYLKVSSRGKKVRQLQVQLDNKGLSSKAKNNTQIAAQKPSDKIFAGYYESWCPDIRDHLHFCDPRNAQDGDELYLAHIASYVNMVIVASMRPNAEYKKHYDLLQTGLQFTSEKDLKGNRVKESIITGNGKAVKKSIAMLKIKNPNTKVLVSVGGYNYTNQSISPKEPKEHLFDRLNVKAIADVVEDFDFDGVDINFEPEPGKYAKCKVNENKGCNTDLLYKNVVENVRSELKKRFKDPKKPKKLLVVSAWSTGAYGEGHWANSPPTGRDANYSRGLLINLLKSSASKAIDYLIVMSYNAGQDYKPVEALAAYQHYFKGKVVMGVQVPSDEWGGNSYNWAKVHDLAQAVVDKNASGIMLWSLQKPPTDERGNVIPASSKPLDAQMISQEVCYILKLDDHCNQSLFSKLPSRTNNTKDNTSQNTVPSSTLMQSLSDNSINSAVPRQWNVQSFFSNFLSPPQAITDDQTPMPILW